MHKSLQIITFRTIYSFVANFKPKIDATSVKIKNNRQNSAGSLKRKIPTKTDPVAPIPVQTA